MYEDIAWKSFEKTGSVESFLEYMQLKSLNNQLNYEQKNIEGVLENEVNQSKGSSYKGNNL